MTPATEPARTARSPVVRRVVDLSHELYDEMPTYPGARRVETEVIHTHERDGYQITALGLITHHGTHVDAPIHFVSGRRTTLSEIPVADLVGEAVVLRVPCGPDEAIDAASLDRALAEHGEELPERPIFLLNTGFHDRFGGDAELYGRHHPYVTEDGAQWLVRHDARVVGLDSSGFERHGAPIPQESVAHNTLLGAGVVLIEELVRLDHVDWPRPLVVVAPLPVRNADGAPARVYALEFA
jgi:arylformamidase